MLYDVRIIVILGGSKMVDEKMNIQNDTEVETNLLRMLDRGIDDIESGRTLAHEDAMNEVRRLRNKRREERVLKGDVVNA